MPGSVDSVWRRFAILAVVAALGFPSCTTPMRPAACHGGPYRCDEETDVKFCESEVIAVEGTGCAAVGLAPSKHFCFVTHASCVDTTYEVEDRDCKVVRYRPLREWRECSPGTPTFVGP